MSHNPCEHSHVDASVPRPSHCRRGPAVGARVRPGSCPPGCSPIGGMYHGPDGNDTSCSDEFRIYCIVP